jgi:hypothetical protein
VDDEIAQGPMLAPRQVLMQLLVRHLLREANCGAHHVLVFLGQPTGFTGQIDIDFEVQSGNEFSRIIANDHLLVIDDGDG